VLFQADPRGSGFIALTGRHYFNYRPDTGDSWINLPKCSGPIIYYASLATNVIKMFPQSSVDGGPCGELIGKSSSIYLPQGLFVDANNNLWVANSGEKNVLEFAPGAIKPELVLNDPRGEPVGVAVDNNNGTVYVSNLTNVPPWPLAVEVYSKGSTFPTGQLTDPNMGGAFYPAIDNAGDVYVTFLDRQSVAHVDEWIGGAGNPVTLNVSYAGAFSGPIVTTKNGALLVCTQDQNGNPSCGEFLRGSNALTNIFAQSALDPIGLTLNRRETVAFTNDFQRSEIEGWTYPGPDTNPLFTKVVGVDGGEAIAARPPAPNGKPYYMPVSK
jgi:DNA-binding beta-propeller fold protein YncE